ncbi:SDR family oxidoreductase [Devosia riboflavina]
MSKEILVIGGTGNVGAALVQELVARGETVRVGTRRPEKVSVSGAKAVLVDLHKAETLGPALEGVDRLFLLAPTGEEDALRILAPVVDEAARRRVKVVLQTAGGIGADDSIPLRQAEIRLEKSGTTYVILRPNWFSDNFENYWGHGVLAGEINVPAGNSKTSFIDTRDIADAAAAALTSDKFDNQTFTLTGPEALSYADAAALISKATGRTVTYRSVDDSVFIPALLSAGLSQGYAQLLAGIFYPVREGWAADVTDAVETLTGKKARTLAAYVTENAAKFIPA